MVGAWPTIVHWRILVALFFPAGVWPAVGVQRGFLIDLLDDLGLIVGMPPAMGVAVSAQAISTRFIDRATAGGVLSFAVQERCRSF